MLLAYKLAILVLIYFAVFYLFLIDIFRDTLRKLIQRKLGRRAELIHIGMGMLHIALGMYVIGCVIYFVWSL